MRASVAGVPAAVLALWVALPLSPATSEMGGRPGAAMADPASIATGPFDPDWQSLKQYECPTWFRDAKFGIWAHWSPQCVPEQGDWYARNMYIEGSGQYKSHVENYGHPSKFGYKDICNLWTAGNWDPDRLMRLYKRAGARYFVALANHHCNFDCWDSKFHAWNCVNIGPKKDIVGTWAETARRHGLRFGVTVHAARAWNWFEVSRDSDKQGPLAGVPYDGVLTKADGKGQWWEGFDPQELYCRPHEPGTPPDEAYVDEWFNRTRDLIDSYDPDLLYFDDSQLPLGEAGLKIAAHYYNANMQRHRGRLQAVLTTKNMPPELRGTLVWDIERGRSDRLEEHPWQTDTCIGEWHYHRGIGYKTAAQVIAMLADIVSKNGNLLLNIPVRGDGTIDDDEVAFLEEMARWMDVNKEAIFGTRPWIAYGEGPAKARGGSFSEGAARPYSARDIRFTTKGRVLYAIALGWPADGKLVIQSLGKVAGTTGQVAAVRLLGHKGTLKWTHDEIGLTVTMPAGKPCDHAYVLKITGRDLRGFKPELSVRDEAIVVAPDAEGNLTLEAAEAELHGEQVRIEQRVERPNIGYWDSAEDWVSWTIKVSEPGTYTLTARCAAAAGATEFLVELNGQALEGEVPQTSSWDDYVEAKLGTLELRTPGNHVLKVRPREAATWKPMNLLLVRMERLPREGG